MAELEKVFITTKLTKLRWENPSYILTRFNRAFHMHHHQGPRSNYKHYILKSGLLVQNKSIMPYYMHMLISRYSQDPEQTSRLTIASQCPKVVELLVGLFAQTTGLRLSRLRDQSDYLRHISSWINYQYHEHAKELRRKLR